jgi:hypothetical protein
MKSSTSYKFAFYGMVGCILFLMLALFTSCQKEVLSEERTQQPSLQSNTDSLSNYLSGDYYIYRVAIGPTSNQEVTYYSLAPAITDLLGVWQTPSPNIFDFDGEPNEVDTPDLLNLIGGYGNVYTPDWDLNDITVDFQASSGWQVQIPGWDVAFLKVTIVDEPCNCFVPETLVSFFLEGFKDGNQIKVWYH